MFDTKKAIEKLKHENAVLKNRCRVYTSGMLCVLCNLDCPDRVAAFQDKETLETLFEAEENEDGEAQDQQGN